jgi:hypothetical protein
MSHGGGCVKTSLCLLYTELLHIISTKRSSTAFDNPVVIE